MLLKLESHNWILGWPKNGVLYVLDFGSTCILYLIHWMLAFDVLDYLYFYLVICIWFIWYLVVFIFLEFGRMRLGFGD